MYLWETTFWTFPLLNPCSADLRVVWRGWGTEHWLDWISLVMPEGLQMPGQFPWPKFKHLCTVPVRHLTQTSCLGLPTCKLEQLLKAKCFTQMRVGPLCCFVDSVCCICCYKRNLQTNHSWFVLNSHISNDVRYCSLLISNTHDGREQSC